MATTQDLVYRVTVNDNQLDRLIAKTNLLGQSFQIKNPNAVANCGCGTSFSI